jgi:pimeloyl-ACP methyl ester carboxylesterase
LAIFVHGFFGGYLSTWGALPDLLFQNADASQPFSDWDYLFLGYKTPSIETYLDIAGLLSTQISRAIAAEAPYIGTYSQFSLLGHSLGTLGIRQFLCAWSLREPALADKVRSVTLFGTPSSGSPWAPVVSPALKAARGLTESSAELRMLREWTSGARKAAKWPAPRIVLGLADRVVSSKADLRFAGDNPQIESSNFGHFALVKPNSWGESGVIDLISATLQ